MRRWHTTEHPESRRRQPCKDLRTKCSQQKYRFLSYDVSVSDCSKKVRCQRQDRQGRSRDQNLAGRMEHTGQAPTRSGF